MDDFSLPRIYRFDSFLLDRHTRSVSRIDDAGNETPVPIGSRAFDLLCLLVEQSGTLLSKSEIMQAVWGNALVEDANLTMQISTLRRTLDAGRPDGSCIQTVPGRGYRFLPRVVPWSPPPPLSDAPIVPARPANDAVAGPNRPSAPVASDARPRRGGRRSGPAPFCSPPWVSPPAAMSGFASTATPFADRPRCPWSCCRSKTLAAIRETIRMAEAVTDDLTTHLSRISLECSSSPARRPRTYKGNATSPREIGDALGVRYVLEGSVHEAGDATRIDVELIETDTEAHLWADRFDLPAPPGGGNGRDGLDRQIGQAMNIALTDAASARGRREHPDDPDAFDLILQARSLSLSHAGHA